MPPRRDGVPVICDVTGETERLERVALGEKEISVNYILLYSWPEMNLYRDVSIRGYPYENLQKSRAALII